MNNQEKLKIFKNLQEMIVREFGRRVERGELLNLTTMVRIAVDFNYFLSNTEAIADPADKDVADMHETIHTGLEAVYSIRKLAKAFPRKNGNPDYAWPDHADFAQFKAAGLATFEKMTDINIGAESRLACMLDLARLELAFLGMTL